MTADHPRDRFDLIPSQPAERAFADALASGRLHHAWLLGGVEGMGKATFAYRAARRLLGAAPDPSRGPLGARPDDPVSRLVSAQAHPDLLVLERQVEGGKLRRSISVEQARGLPEFFSMTPSRAAYRVAVIDAADDLNINAANALLKILEEPPERGVVFLIAHAPGRLLPTIRSRCRRLAFRPWSVDALERLLTDSGAEAGTALSAARMAGGSPGRALALTQAASLELDATLSEWIASGWDPAAALAVSDTFRGAEGPARFEAAMDRLADGVRRQALARAAGAGAGQGAAWADLWTRLVETPDRVAGLNMEKADAFAAALHEVDELRRSPC